MAGPHPRSVPSVVCRRINRRSDRQPTGRGFDYGRETRWSLCLDHLARSGHGGRTELRVGPSWFKAHYENYDKAASDFDTAKWNIDHTRRLRQLRLERSKLGERVFIEGEKRHPP